MDIEKAREVLGDEAKLMIDEEIIKLKEEDKKPIGQQVKFKITKSI